MSNSSIRYPTAPISDLESTEVVTLSNSLIIDQPDSTRKTTLASILSSLGIMRCISFSKGGVLESQKDIAFYEEDGTFYTWNGPYPKIVEAGSTPKESGGVGSNAWINNKDTPLVRVWKYRAAVDGETTIQLPKDIPIVDVQAIYVQGLRQDLNEGFTYNAADSTIILADELEAGDLVTVIIGIADLGTGIDIFAALKGTDGASNVGTSSGDSVQDVLDNLLLNNQQLTDKLASNNGASNIGTLDGITVEDALSNSAANIREHWRRQLSDAGLNLVDGSFEEGATANSSTDAVWHIAAGQCYYWEGALPKTIPASSSPVSTGGIADGAWRSVGDIALRYSGDGSQLSVLAAGSDTPRTLADRFADVVNVKDFGAVGDGITDDTRSIQAAINAANPFGKKIYVPAGRYKCGPLIAKQGFKLFGSGNRHNSSTIEANISLFLCDLADGEAFISYVGDGKWPEGEVEIDNLAFENLNSLGGTAGVVAANNRVFWAVGDSADVYPTRWIQKKEGGANCPKSVFTRCTFSKFFIGIDIHSWMSRFEDLTSYSCGVLLRAYGTSNIVNRVWAVDPLWAGIQMKSTYSEVNACSFGEQPTNNAAAKGFELHGGYVVINGCGAEATIEDFIWAYNGSLIVNNSRPSTALPTKNFITIDAYANALINNSYTPGSFSNSFSRAKDIFALDGITISPAPRCTDTNKLPFTESAFNASSGYYEGLCGTASKEASAIVLKTNNQNTNPKWSGESTLRSLPLLWEYSGTVRGSSILKSDVNFLVNGNFLNTDGGYQFDCRISKISNKGVILSSKLQDSGVLVSVYKKAGTWSHDYVYYGAAAGLTNDKGEQLIKAVFFQGDPLSTIRITIRDEVMTGKTEDELANSQVELIVNASGDVPLLTGQNEAFTYSMRTTP